VKIAYIAGPYRAKTPYGIMQNIKKAEDAAAKYISQGYAVICPHKNTAFFDGLIRDKDWLNMYITILSRCDVCIMIEGWQGSEGAKREHDEAISRCMEIIYDSQEPEKVT
jgi:hypothetical protein